MSAADRAPLPPHGDARPDDPSSAALLAHWPAPADAAARPVPAESLDALFAPAGSVVAPTPAPFHLLELVRPLLAADPTAIFREYTLRYPNGVAVHVEQHGHATRGLLTVADLDLVFAAFDLLREAGSSSGGASSGNGSSGTASRWTLDGIVMTELAYRLGYERRDLGGAAFDRLRTALDRISAFRLRTNFDITAARRLDTAREGRSLPAAVDALPHRVRPKLEWRYLFKHGEAEQLAADGTPLRQGNVMSLTFDPAWLDGMQRGWTAWVDTQLHAALDGYAKRLYGLLLVRALRVPTWSSLEPAVVATHELLEEMGVPYNANRFARSVQQVLAACRHLTTVGVLRAVDELPGRGRRHRLALVPGERLLAARQAVALRPEEAAASARLVWGLQQAPWALAPGEARRWADTAPGTALRVLQRAVYLSGTGWSPSTSWSAWVNAAIAGDYRFDGDARFQAWLTVRQRGHVVPPSVDVRVRPTLAVRPEPPVSAALASAAAPVEAPRSDAAREAERFEPTAWGRLRAALAERLGAEGAPEQYDAWVRPLVLRACEVDGGQPAPDDGASADAPDAGPGAAVRLVLQAPDAFAAEWVRRRYAPLLAELGADLGWRALAVEVEAREEPGADPAAAPPRRRLG